MANHLYPPPPPPPVDPAWRTPDVLALCRGMREAQDYSGCPALADALQEAGCTDDDGLLRWLRDQALTYADAATVVALVASDDTQTSIRWLVDLAVAYGLAPATMIEAGRRFLDKGQYLVGGENFEGESTPPEFWAHFEAVTGRVVDPVERRNFFSCAC